VKKRFTSGFSLVELTLAIGIAAFCLIAVFGLIPVAALTNRNATSQTAATNLMAAVIADLRATPSTSKTSLQFAIPFGTNGTITTRYFDSQAQCSCDSAGLQKPNPLTRTCSAVWTPALQPRYRLTITWSGSSSLRYADLKATWPAAVDPTTTTPSGSTEMFAAFDRN
jgi:Tfp pilus assembly protein PilV